MPIPPLITQTRDAISGAVESWFGNQNATTIGEFDMGPNFTPRYWRIRLEGSTQKAQSSSDGINWTEEDSVDFTPGQTTAAAIGRAALHLLGWLAGLFAQSGGTLTANPDDVGGDSEAFIGPQLLLGDEDAPAGEWVEWIDAQGRRTATVVTTLSMAAGGATFITDAVAGCSNAEPLRVIGEQLVLNAAPSPDNAQWPSVDDAAELVFQSATTTATATIRVPAPKAAIFLADGETVDAAQASVATLIAAATDASHGLRCADGTRAGSYVGGYRRGRRGPAR